MVAILEIAPKNHFNKKYKHPLLSTNGAFLLLKTTHQKSVKDETFCTNYIKRTMY